MNIRISSLAAFKLERLLEYLEEEWSANSKDRFLKTFHNKLKFLEKNPSATSQSQIRQDLRKLVVTNQTSLLFTISDNTIFVITIFDNRQNPDKLKKEIIDSFGKY
jgi:plasmid stabilization system protein ParE